jgi:riboflavin kinase / FMN adenylyltransferase
MTLPKPAFLTLTSPADLPAHLKGAVAAIGNFDGVHRGHQAVVELALERGRDLGAPVVAVTFEPHPRSVFRPDQPVFRLTPAVEKARLLEALGLDAVLVIPFTADFAALTAHAFVEDILVGRLGLKHAVVGYDFHFGAGRSGSPAFLHAEGARLGFGVDTIPAFLAEDGLPVSSSRIRDALARGDLAEASGLLGYRWFVAAEIIHGAKRGRQLGIPTANMALAPECGLAHGVYAVTFHVEGRIHNGVANFGRRPQFDNGAPLLETHVLDFDGDLYGKLAEVTFVSRLRPELKFSGVDALVAQMQTDIAEARTLLTSLHPGTVLDRALDDLP